ncbi:hypothetical protein [Paraglaciecola psychrophila]|uniref:Uncharacterized protein n=1 Tax=Paraglaciecola psychrophila 170 TaxID=1129794 RepID=K6YVX3_9ALTE|nr:hypothetical protein [Paraglaciecola psychrophila]AGH45549.1 hypothetical protein C427_3440 [Paraglaciecola psychrophila 170]GAC36854.1 hypothetical protein GPSY_1217 [Paraglaciecola psychrophila 170]
MDQQLHQTTLNLISLIHFYQRASGDNEKIRNAIQFSESLKDEGIGASNEKRKLQFCSEAVLAIASVVESKSETINKGWIASLLDREEIDFIRDMVLKDDRDEDKYESNQVNNKKQMGRYRT